MRQHPGLAAPGDTLSSARSSRPRPTPPSSSSTTGPTATLVDGYLSAVTDRDGLAARFNAVNPAVHAQNLLSETARTDLASYVDFLRQLPAFHQRIVGFLLPAPVPQPAPHPSRLRPPAPLRTGPANRWLPAAAGPGRGAAGRLGGAGVCAGLLEPAPAFAGLSIGLPVGIARNNGYTTQSSNTHRNEA
ncbi:MAG: DUF3526 domain-containing protein, partial [Hymenobacter sp.]